MSKTISVTIIGKKPVAEGIYEFTLAPEAGNNLPSYQAGAHIDVCIDDVTVRQYSLMGEFEAPSVYKIGVMRDPDGRGGSQRLCDSFQVGDTLTISEPRNLFSLQPAAHYG
ncbi:hypothetical protein [Marinobacterium litorale]|uniref:hypothetical protein n=1 Tax=Marinobacterium litorale TaxID=404770 RepID=UPI0004891692|nr:hypothetical protein [Marinobacterium litorale]